jgi:hypothetical protein
LCLEDDPCGRDSLQLKTLQELFHQFIVRRMHLVCIRPCAWPGEMTRLEIQDEKEEEETW